MVDGYRNPNAPSRMLFLTQADLDWPEYDTSNKSYLSLGIPPKIGHRYRQKMMNFWNDHIPDVFKNLPPNESSKNHERPEILPPEIYPRRPLYPQRQDKNPEVNTWFRGFPVFSTPPPSHVYGNVIMSSNEKPRSPSSGLLGDRGFGSNSPLENIPKKIQDNVEIDLGSTPSWAMSIVIVVGVCFLLINICAFAGLYYQRDRLKVQERLIRKRYEDVETTNNEDLYIRNIPDDGGDGGNLENLEGTSKKGNKKKSQDEVYEAVRSRDKTLDGHNEFVMGEDTGEFKRWKLSRQCSASTMDPHTKVKEWIAHEIVQRCSPRFLRKSKQPGRPILQKGESFDTYIEHFSAPTMADDTKNPAPSSPALSKPTTTTTLQRSKVKKVSVAVDATPGARGSSVMKQIPIEQMSKSMEELVSGKCVSTSEITLQQQKAALKRSETCRESLARSSCSSDPNNMDTVLRRSTTSISLQLCKPPQTAHVSGLTISHQHSKSDPVPHSTSYSSQHAKRPQLVNISLDSKESQSTATHSKGIASKHMKSFRSTPHSRENTLKEVPIPQTPSVNSKKDVNVTSRDSSDKEESLCTVDPLKTIQRRNFPKVLPDLPHPHDKELDDSDGELPATQTMSARRRSLPPQTHLIVGLVPPDGDIGSFSQPTTPKSVYHKNLQIQTGKVPPPPPPRVSTLGRKPNNTAPVTSFSSSFESQDSIHLKSSASSPMYQQRPEPRVIIKPTSTAPVTRNPSQQGRTKHHIPRVIPDSGDEYPLTPTAVHHHHHHHHHGDFESLTPSLSRQSSIRSQGPPSPSFIAPIVPHSPTTTTQQFQWPAEKPASQLQSGTMKHETQHPSEHTSEKSLVQHTQKNPCMQKSDVSTSMSPMQAKATQQSKSQTNKSTGSSKSSSFPSEDTSSNTGTIRRVKKGNDTKTKTPGNSQDTSTTKSAVAPKAWYAQYNQSFLSKSKDSDKN